MVAFNPKKDKVMLAQTYKDQDIIGWWVSEKLDGVRAIYVDGDLYSRTGKPINAPDSFLSKFPKGVVLDGELVTTRGDFKGVVSTVRKKVPVESEWKSIKFAVFDLIDDSLEFEDRIDKLQRMKKHKNIRVVKHTRVKDMDSFWEKHDDIVSSGAEGSMVRRPESMYEHKRSNSLLKVKEFQDDEAIVIGHEYGEGKYADMLGKLRVRWKDGRKHKKVEFKVGTGFDDEERRRYKTLIPLGSTIVVKYFEISESGKPRFPVYVGPRAD